VTIADAPAGYPAHRIADVVLRDGSTVRIRPVLPSDTDALVELFEGLSDETTYLRFHARHRVTAKEVERHVNVDYRDRFGLVAETSAGGGRVVVGLVNYVRVADDKAEMAVVIADRFHGRGIGSLLIEHLGEAAAEAGIPTFTAEILGGNLDMLEVIRSSELPVEREIESGVVHAEFPTTPTPEAIAAFEQREATAAAAGVRAFLEPRSVAVIGASRDPNSIGGALFRNLLEGRFNGPVYPVNAKAESVQSVAAYPSVTAVPGEVDLAVVVIPAPLVPEIARECARKGVRALLVISSGFAEVGDEGRALQDELLEIARGHGMRIVGPNCMGLMNLQPDLSLNATFAPVVPPHGRLAFSSQSGALGIAVMDLAKELGLGLSSFVSVGNKADISGNDLIQYWEQDDDTGVILLYLESFGNPRKFARIARRVSNQKPVVAVKSGRSQAGERAAASHTGSLAAGDVAVDALFRQAGVIRTDTLDELFDVANLLGHQPLPEGKRVAILTNAGGLGVMCADACEAEGLELPELSPGTVARLRELLPAEAGITNPVDMIASATAEHYGEALRVLAADEKVDSIIVIFIPPLVTRAEDVAQALMETSAAMKDKTVLSCFLGVRGVHEHLRSRDVVIPSHTFPESAARALARVSDYAAWRRRPEGSVPEFPDVDRDRAAALAATQLEGGARWLEPASVADLLALRTDNRVLDESGAKHRLGAFPVSNLISVAAG
jgi:acetate---CoA ligase (ADP-forming)